MNLYHETDKYACHTYGSREEWLKGRKGGIGGSSASSLINKNPYKDNNTLWKEIKGLIIPEDISEKPYVKYGNDAEPLLRQLFALDYPQYDVQYMDNTILVNKDRPWMKYSPDGLLLETETSRRGIFENKTTNILQSRQKENWNNQVPMNYYIQVLWGLLVTGFDFVVLKAQLKSEWKNDDGLKEIRLTTKHYYFTREEVQEDLDWLQKEAERIWNTYYVANIEPPTELLI